MQFVATYILGLFYSYHLGSYTSEYDVGDSSLHLGIHTTHCRGHCVTTTPSTKPEVHITYRSAIREGPSHGEIHTNLMKFDHEVFEIYARTDRHAHYNICHPLLMEPTGQVIGPNVVSNGSLLLGGWVTLYTVDYVVDGR